MTVNKSGRILILLILALVILLTLVFVMARSTPDNTSTSTPTKTIHPEKPSSQATFNSPTLLVTESAAQVQEQTIITIPLTGPVAESRSEISGMAWYSETLLLLPQYPSRFGPGDGVIFGLEKSDILAYLDGTSAKPLYPKEIQFSAPGIAQIDGFQGFESIAIDGKRVVMTVEARPGDMMGYLITGYITPDQTTLSLNLVTTVAIQPPVQIENMAFEAVLFTPDQVLTFFEANGSVINPSPYVQVFSNSGESMDTLPMAALEYRLTDVTSLDSAGRFWGINYFYPGDIKLKPANDVLVKEYGEGATHALYTTVERLVLMQYSDAGITLAPQPPIQLQLMGDDQARNWEAIALLDERGFLLATDKYPQTILAFVELP